MWTTEETLKKDGKTSNRKEFGELPGETEEAHEPDEVMEEVVSTGSCRSASVRKTENSG